MTCHKLSKIFFFYMLMIHVCQDIDINETEKQLNEDYLIYVIAFWIMLVFCG